MSHSTVHLADPGMLHGIRCNHRGATAKTHDDIRVTCSLCRGLGRRREDAPERAVRYEGVLHTIDGGANRPGQLLDLGTVIFVGGGLLWFEEPNVVAVMHAREGGAVRRYEGSWVAVEP